MIKGGVSLFFARECRGHAVSPLAASTDAGFGRLESAPLARGQGRAAARRESATS
jgi:hypothetical protein